MAVLSKHTKQASELKYDSNNLPMQKSYSWIDEMIKILKWCVKNEWSTLVPVFIWARYKSDKRVCVGTISRVHICNTVNLP